MRGKRARAIRKEAHRVYEYINELAATPGVLRHRRFAWSVYGNRYGIIMHGKSRARQIVSYGPRHVYRLMKRGKLSMARIAVHGLGLTRADAKRITRAMDKVALHAMRAQAKRKAVTV